MVYVRMVNTEKTLCNFGSKEMSIGTKSHIQCSTGNQGAKYLKLHRKHGIITGKFIAVEACF